MRIKLLAVATLMIALSACKKSITKPEGLPPYKILESAISDHTGKLMVKMRVLSQTPSPSPESIESMLVYLVDSIRSNTSTKEFPSPKITEVLLFNEIGEFEGGGRHCAMIDYSEGLENPITLIIDTTALALGLSDRSEKWGLGYEKRLQIFKIDRNSYFNNDRKTYENFKNEILSNHSISMTQLDLIITEGNSYGWPWKH